MADHKIRARLGLDDKEFEKGLKNAQRQLSGLGDSFKKMASLFGLGLGVREITRFTNEATRLAASAEGVRAGFDHLAKPGLLKDLRTATRGAVSDFQLMQTAIQASNFEIPLENLASLLKFASARAIQTGQSVDYLVQSIILGIGRKSPLILDNLGISAVRLREVLAGAGVEMSTVGDVAAAVGKIATEELFRMGEVADTSATQIAQLTVASEKLKETWGEFVNREWGPKRAILIDWLQTMNQIFTDPNLSEWQKITMNPDKYKEYKKEQGYIDFDMYSGGESSGGPLENINKQIIKRATTLASLNEQLEDEKKLLEQIDVADTKTLKTQQQVIIDLQKRIKSLTELREINPMISKMPVNMGFTEEVDNSYKEMIQQFYDFQKVRNNMAPGPEVKEGTEDLTRALNIQWEAVNILSDAFYNLFTSTGDGFKDMANAIINSIQRIAAEMAAKVAIFGLIRLLFPGSDLAVGATKGLWSMFGINGFATGGMVYGPQLAMVGENSSRSNPEVIAPLDKLAGMMGNNIKVEVVGTISARDIKLSNRRS